MSRLDIRAKTRLPAKVSYHDDSNSEEQVIIAELSLCGARIINLSYEGKDIITIKPRLPKCDEIGVRGEIVRKCDGGVATRFYFSDTSVKKKLWEYIKDNLSQSAFCPYCNHRISNGAEYCINCNFFLNYHDTAYLVKHDRETFVARLINRSHRLNVEQMRVLLNFMDTNLLREKGIALLGELVGAGQDRRDTTFPPGDLVPLGKSHRSKNRGNNRNRLYFKTNISQHPKMIQILKLIDQVADTEATVLITGESGTGKELVARELHYKSKRKDNLFLPINCGAIPENLLESELFGHVQGAFTGAVSEKPGIFKSAEGGTILLDEVSEMPTSLQVKLLRVLQSGNTTRWAARRFISAMCVS
ncbi:MAG: sigma-54 factor interaction domain-containing protein [Candidatus Scalindua sp.]|nr:sigma-54 factor interaction domain-containing protein [Candidatus Scalindua sp.]